MINRRLWAIKKEAKEKYESIEKKLFEAEKRAVLRNEKLRDLQIEYQKLLSRNVDLLKDKDFAEEELRKFKKEYDVMKKSIESLEDKNAKQ